MFKRICSDNVVEILLYKENKTLKIVLLIIIIIINKQYLKIHHSSSVKVDINIDIVINLEMR